MRKVTKQTGGKLTAKQTAELEALQALPDSEIDYSDISPANSEEWRDAVVGKFYRPIKQQLTLRIDADVIDWFKQQGRGYQTRINELLRDAMRKDAKH
ncbi:MAG: BrnA antitoxin family protein [Gammaproteobacteria bacterium]|nr:BrnA antitoxin family protein [Gammaproteobacteria bacterium]MBU1646120.1 BrnA antitoxin family protein [Gammaproteobacteria bacterium]MBU1972182.1 BrnA antitoxin family protein [Gammaproteobacteria bacterium]